MMTQLYDLIIKMISMSIFDLTTLDYETCLEVLEQITFY